MLNNGDVVQIINEEHHWFPCLVVVQEVKTWGVQAYLLTPPMGEFGVAYIRVKNADIKLIGQAEVTVE